MDLNKLMQFALEHHTQVKLKEVQLNAVTELLSRTFIRNTDPTQREHELSLSVQEIFNNFHSEDEETREMFLEIIGNAKNIIIDIANQMETDQ